MKLLFTLFTFVFSGMLNAQTKNDQLFEAVQKNEKDKIELLLKAGCDPNYVKIGSPYMEITPLVAAVQNKNSEVARLLIDNKANVNWKDNLGYSAIMYAVNANDLNMVKLLAAKGADLKAQTPEGKSLFKLSEVTGNKELIQYFENKN